MFVFPVASPFRLRVSHHFDRATFPIPATSNAACGFPTLRSPACFTSRLWDLSCWGDFQPPNLAAAEQLQGFVQPLPTPPRPTEALSLPSPHQIAPDLLFHPVLNVAKAFAGVPNREVIHPIHGLGLVAVEHVFELPQQRRSFLELRRKLRLAERPIPPGGVSQPPSSASHAAGRHSPRSPDRQQNAYTRAGVLAIACHLFCPLEHSVYLGEIEITEQWGDHSALRNAASAIGFIDSFRHFGQQSVVPDVVKIAPQIDICQPIPSPPC
jgi:hypothetical protein